MVIKEVLNVIAQALELGSKNGAYGISDGAIIKSAYASLTEYVKENEESETLVKEEPESVEKETE